MRKLTLAIVLIGAILGWSTTAVAKPKKKEPVLRITPKHPYIDDAITVHINPAKPLPKGKVFRVAVDALDGRIGDGFSHLAVVNTRSKNVLVTPEDDPLGGNEWEQGKAFVLVTEVRKGAGPGAQGKIVGPGFVMFRFYGLP
jgi:hypothetical protein